jgi:protein-disulfide isomerase
MLVSMRAIDGFTGGGNRVSPACLPLRRVYVMCKAAPQSCAQGDFEMIRPIRLVCGGLLLIVAAFGLAGASRAAEFTPAQRAEIVQILRDALRKDPSILRDAVGALQADEAHRQSEAVKAHEATLVSTGDPVAGNPQGDVTIVEFFDVRCPYCRRFEPVMASLLAQDHGVRLVYKDLPVLGPASILGARALLAADRQGGYEKLRGVVMQSMPDVTKASLEIAAKQVGLDWARLQHDMDDPAVQKRLNDNIRLARELGIDGTPALIIGHTLIPGALELSELKQMVTEARQRMATGGQEISTTH